MNPSGLKRQVKEAGKRLLRRLFESGQRFGVDVLPRHFYSSVPDIAELKRSDHWLEASSMSGVAGADPEEQLRFAREVCGPHVDRLRAHDVYAAACDEAAEVGYSRVDAEFLYCFVRSRRPGRIVQVGCGASTALLLAACRDAGYRPELVCVEPYPSPYLRRMDKAGDIRLVARKAQEVELSLLHGLDAGGFLFVDSTHTVKPGSEVVRIVLEAMPRLPPGVYVHFHDVYFPYGYQRGLLLDELFFSSETLLLQALLTQNPHYTIRTSLSMLHYAQPRELQGLLPHYRPAPNRHGLSTSRRGGGDFPSATYLQTVAVTNVSTANGAAAGPVPSPGVAGEGGRGAAG